MPRREDSTIPTWFDKPRLRFPSEQEAIYRRSVSGPIVQIMQIGGLAGMIAIPAFVVNDLLFDPDALARTLPVRLGIAALILCAEICFLFRRVTGTPALIGLITYALFVAFAAGLVVIQAVHANGFLVTVPGYIQVMIFIPIVCFSFLQAFVTVFSMALVGVAGAWGAGASATEVMNLANWLGGSAAFALGAAFIVDGTRRRSFMLEQELSTEKARADALLLNILPEKIAERLKAKEKRIADHCPCVTVLFADIAGFTAWSRELDPGALVDLLNELFSRFDRLAESHGVEKIKTIGDGYMAVAGLRTGRAASEAAAAVAALALDMQAAFSRFRDERDLPLALRIGLHSGPVVAGVIGERKIAFDLWGDTVNIASRVEAACPPDQIQITRETRALIGPGFVTRPSGWTELRGHAPRELFALEPSG